jgi:hypothetical protein
VISTRPFLTGLSTLVVCCCVLVPAAPSADAVPVGEAPTLPAGATPLGVVPPQQELNLYVALEPQDPAGLESFATEVSTPGSPRYGQYLSVEGFADRFGATPVQVATVRSALRARGLTVGQASENNLSLPVQTTAAEAEVALGTSFERVRTADGRVAFANTSAPEVPAAAAPYVAGVIGLDDLNVPQNQVQQAATSDRLGPGAPRTAGTTSVLTGGPRPVSTRSKRGKNSKAATPPTRSPPPTASGGTTRRGTSAPGRRSPCWRKNRTCLPTSKSSKNATEPTRPWNRSTSPAVRGPTKRKTAASRSSTSSS